MQGALHSFVTALAPIKMHGDYVYEHGHSIRLFPPAPKENVSVLSELANAPSRKAQYRPVVLSTTIHLDFENSQVAMAFFAVNEQGPLPQPFPEQINIPSAAQLSDGQFSLRYEAELRQHAVWHLHKSHRLPTTKEPMEIEAVRALLRRDILSRRQWDVLEGKTVKVHNQLLSLEMMHATLVQSLSNELRGLERLCTNGYVFTWDPPSIFAQMLSPLLLNALLIHAFRDVLDTMPLIRMKAFVFNSYADPASLDLLKVVLKGRDDIACIGKAALFDETIHGVGGHYSGGKQFPSATLVLHNNSDGFGANIETEGCSSLDGVIGCYSSAAASLHRQRSDLIKYLL